MNIYELIHRILIWIFSDKIILYPESIDIINWFNIDMIRDLIRDTNDKYNQSLIFRRKNVHTYKNFSSYFVHRAKYSIFSLSILRKCNPKILRKSFHFIATQFVSFTLTGNFLSQDIFTKILLYILMHVAHKAEILISN